MTPHKQRAAPTAAPTSRRQQVPAPCAGSAVDVIPRLVFDQLSSQLGQPIVVENRVGAGGTIAMATVARSEPNGYTILATASALTVAPWVYKCLPYDTVRDLSGIVALGNVPNVLVTSPEKGLSKIQAFVAAAKAKPGSYNYASGNGFSGRMNGSFAFGELECSREPFPMHLRWILLFFRWLKLYLSTKLLSRPIYCFYTASRGCRQNASIIVTSIIVLTVCRTSREP